MGWGTQNIFLRFSLNMFVSRIQKHNNAHLNTSLTQHAYLFSFAFLFRSTAPLGTPCRPTPPHRFAAFTTGNPNSPAGTTGKLRSPAGTTEKARSPFASRILGQVRFEPASTCRGRYLQRPLGDYSLHSTCRFLPRLHIGPAFRGTNYVRPQVCPTPLAGTTADSRTPERAVQA